MFIVTASATNFKRRHDSSYYYFRGDNTSYPMSILRILLPTSRKESGGGWLGGHRFWSACRLFLLLDQLHSEENGEWWIAGWTNLGTGNSTMQSDLGLDEWKVSNWHDPMRDWCWDARARDHIRGNGKSRGISSIFTQELQKLVCNLIWSCRFQWCNRHRLRMDARWDAYWRAHRGGCVHIMDSSEWCIAAISSIRIPFLRFLARRLIRIQGIQRCNRHRWELDSRRDRH